MPDSSLHETMHSLDPWTYRVGHTSATGRQQKERHAVGASRLRSRNRGTVHGGNLLLMLLGPTSVKDYWKRDLIGALRVNEAPAHPCRSANTRQRPGFQDL